MGSPARELYARALRVLPGGVSRNNVLRRPGPLYAAGGSGCYVTDVEGRRFLDFTNNMASLIHGHAYPPVVDAVTRQLQKGTAFAMATEAEVKLAEHLCSRTKGFDKLRFVNSGTEAVLAAIKASRAFTGRPKIAKIEGAYHGVYDFAEVSQTAQPSNWGPADRPASVPVCQGTPQPVLDNVVVLPFNDAEAALHLLDEHKSDLACVLVDPLPHRLGFIPALQSFIRALHAWTAKHGALFVCDEVITYRSSYSGAQAWFDVVPDLTCLGKMIGGGFPAGAVAGREEVMAVFDPLADNVRFPHGGTFCANPVTMTAGLAAMEHFTPEQVARLNRLGELARKLLTEAIQNAEVPASVTGAGSIFRVHFKPEPPRNYREGFPSAAETRLMAALVEEAIKHEVLLFSTGSGTLSTPMTEGELARFAEVMLSCFKKLRASHPDLRSIDRA